MDTTSIITLVIGVAGYALYGYATGKIVEKSSRKPVWHGFMPFLNIYDIASAVSGSTGFALAAAAAPVAGPALSMLPGGYVLSSPAVLVAFGLFIAVLWMLSQKIFTNKTEWFIALLLAWPIAWLVLAFGQATIMGQHTPNRRVSSDNGSAIASAISVKPMTKSDVLNAFDNGEIDANELARHLKNR